MKYLTAAIPKRDYWLLKLCTSSYEGLDMAACKVTFLVHRNNSGQILFQVPTMPVETEPGRVHSVKLQQLNH